MACISDFTDYLIHEKRYSQHTVQAYKKDIEQFVELMELSNEDELLDVTHMMMRSYVVALVEEGLENSSINRKLSTLKSFYKYLRQTGKMESNPARKIKSLKSKKVLPQFVPETQLWNREIFEEEKTEYKQVLIELIMEMFYQTGIRLTELINLEQKNISSSQIKVLGKRNKERIVPISKELYSLVDRFQTLKDNEGISGDLLFYQESGKKLTPRLVYSKVNYYLGKATNLSKKSPHVLRHTFATHMLNNGASLETIKKLLGHADLSATQIYTHNSFKQIRRIYEQSHPRG